MKIKFPVKAGKQDCNYAEDTSIYDARKKRIAIVAGEDLAKQIARLLNRGAK